MRSRLSHEVTHFYLRWTLLYRVAALGNLGLPLRLVRCRSVSPIFKGGLHGGEGVFGVDRSSASFDGTAGASDTAIVMAHTVSIDAPHLIDASAGVVRRCFHPRVARAPRHISAHLLDFEVAVQALTHLLSYCDFGPDV